MTYVDRLRLFLLRSNISSDLDFGKAVSNVLGGLGDNLRDRRSHGRERCELDGLTGQAKIAPSPNEPFLYYAPTVSFELILPQKHAIRNLNDPMHQRKVQILMCERAVVAPAASRSAAC